MPDEDKSFGGSLVLDFEKVMTSRENDLITAMDTQKPRQNSGA